MTSRKLRRKAPANSPNPDRTFAARVRDAIVRADLTMAEVARQAAIDPSVLSRLLAATAPRRPTLDQILGLARVLNTDAIELAHGTDMAAVLERWVSRDAYDAEVAVRIAAHRDVEAAKSQIESADREIRALRDRLDIAEKQRSDEQRRANQLQFALERQSEKAAQREREMALLRSRYDECERMRTVIRTNLLTTQSQLNAAHQDASRKTGQMALAALLGGLAGAVMAHASDDER